LNPDVRKAGSGEARSTGPLRTSPSSDVGTTAWSQSRTPSLFRSLTASVFTEFIDEELGGDPGVGQPAGNKPTG